MSSRKCSLCGISGHNRQTCNRYNFGPNKFFSGTNEEWEILKNEQAEIIYVSENILSYIKVKCPHCGSINEHVESNGHRACDGWGNKMYDCPGYNINIL